MAKRIWQHRPLVAQTWRRVLHVGVPTPISRIDRSRFDGDGPPLVATPAAESTASEALPPIRRLSSTRRGSLASIVEWISRPAA